MQRIEKVTGYPLDEFQRQALDVIVSNDDLLVTCPTGSGKTVVAITAIILQAFDQGKRAILTTPIKALSNQKYAECNKWLTSIGQPNRITLLTGDIQARATQKGGDGQPELLIMTSEILANKLDQLRSGTEDDDLKNVSVLVIDEMHYINDPDRGHVWERTIMHLPTTIQLVALSATLSEPERFCEWLTKRKSTRLVQRHERHVPLHIGGYDNKGQFVELFSTHGKKAFESATLKRIVTNYGNFSQSVTKLVTTLKKDQKLPAIVFVLSKNRCVEAAQLVDQNLLYGTIPTRGQDQDEDEYKYIKEEHQWSVARIRERQDAMYHHHLGKYRTMLESLPGFETFKSLIDKGIGYHHAGMIPILREYVELLFAEKLLQVVFATETLAVGINMPARSTVFTQVEKPTGRDQTAPLQPDQFWQMAGRAGRRGMDDKGYVIYFPFDRWNATESDLRHMMLERMPPATSQLSINPMFVLKHHTQQGILNKTLLFHQHDLIASALKAKLITIPNVPDDVKEYVKRYGELKKKLEGNGFIKLTQSQRKACEKELSALKLTESTIQSATESIRINEEIRFHTDVLQEEWDNAERMLNQRGFMDGDSLTIKGKVTAGLSDGEPLLRGTMLTNESLTNATFEELVGWLACFTEYLKPQGKLEPEADGLYRIMDDIYALESEFKCTKEIQYDMGLLMYIWVTTKDIKSISRYVDIGNIGVFIKAVLRVISFIDEMKTILLGLQMYELYNRMDNHQDRLLEGIVTNRSLYV